jgi:hypothetical protein
MKKYSNLNSNLIQIIKKKNFTKFTIWTFPRTHPKLAFAHKRNWSIGNTLELESYLLVSLEWIQILANHYKFCSWMPGLLDPMCNISSMWLVLTRKDKVAAKLHAHSTTPMQENDTRMCPSCHNSMTPIPLHRARDTRNGIGNAYWKMYLHTHGF